ncbi:uncharacterized protein LOC125960239 isoform X2 [Orcinus orca]|uniref:protein EOLA1 isoform X2 n=1 Tax=Sagmatias obliquidens TaxID=3371155 RepID=UPI000F43F155|nr:protein CXorf40A homolog isoform X2 [Lagenorhynchus obliquidens]XP_030702836.1 protein CXorf40B homolog isoform X2 [Globicephala melas]XP_049560381.1 uncharacterized protein LOC125960239 isoform X2 [Orcinus orca]
MAWRLLLCLLAAGACGKCAIVREDTQTSGRVFSPLATKQAPSASRAAERGDGNLPGYLRIEFYGPWMVPVPGPGVETERAPVPAREALGALGDEVRLPVLPAALCGFRLKWGEDPGDAVAARAERPAAPHPGRPHRAQGLGGRGLEGAAGREAGDEPRADPGLAAGRGEVRPRSDSRAG